MSRPSSAATRNLSLTEELEKLEQSITLTLQEIDHNFSRAHRIVTSSILPIVEQYADHSKAVWEGSKFWKQFFEASANVSLSGYEELAANEEEEDTALSHSQDAGSAYDASVAQPRDDTVQSVQREDYNPGDESLLGNEDISGSTPRAPQLRSVRKDDLAFAEYSSPYEALKQELKGPSSAYEAEDDTQIAPTTPGAAQRLPDMSMTPASSLFEPTSYLPSATQRRPGGDPLLHRVLDKNYRLQATPHMTREEKTTTMKPSWQSATSPDSSPLAAPELRANIFDSPLRQRHSPTKAPRTPGISVQTPAKGGGNTAGYLSKKDEISWESDSDADAEDIYKELGMSPPKTIKFALQPSRLLQTPAREASQRIVDDLLLTAGAGQDTDEEDSPSMVKMKSDLLDDSF